MGTLNKHRQFDPRRSQHLQKATALFLALCAWSNAGAQERPPVWRLGAFGNLSATDNALASSVDRQAGVGTEAGIDAHLTLPYRRVRGFADYTLVGAVSRTDDDTLSNHRHDLRAGLNAEVIESHAFLDLAALYGVHFGSVFGSPERSLLVENGNRTESGTITVSPSLRTRLGESGRAEVRAVDSTTKFRRTSVGDIHSRAGSLLVDSGVRPGTLTWKGAGYGAEYQPDDGRRTTEATVRGDLGWAFDADTVTSVVVGREGNDFETSRRVYSDLYGLSLDYRPNERTRFYAEGLRRFFGTGYTLSLSYRLPHFAVIGSANRSNSRPGLGLESSNAFDYGSAYDVLFLQLSSVEPDPDRRRLLVQDLLIANGIDPSEQVVPEIVTSGVLLVESASISLVWSGVRNTIILSASQGSSRRLGELVSLPINDEFRTEDRVDQKGFQASWLRRLTPVDDLSVVLDWTRAEGALTLRTSSSRSASVQWARKLTVQSTLSVSASHQSFESSTDSDYHIRTVTCEYRVRF